MRTLRNASRVILILLPFSLPAQYPTGQYPPVGYPPNNPNTYPNTYPPNTYPPNTYPGPGGIGLPIPSIHLPGRKPKTPASETPKVAVASVEGTLRRLAEKELLLQVRPDHVLRFRLLAKTLFRDKDGKPVRDSLLHPGDRLRVEANPDDSETALYVVLVRAGSKAERSAAAEPVESAKIATPESEDLGKPHDVAGADASSPAAGTSGTADDDRPVLTRKPIPGDTTTEREKPVNQLIDPVIGEARTAAQTFTSDLPNFTVQQITTRYQGSVYGGNWRAIDIVTTDVSSVDGKEEYNNIRVNGRPLSGPPENSGSWSTGEFSTTLEDILSPYTAATFTLRGEDRIANRPALVYDLAVEQSRSHWILVSPDKHQYKPAYKGSLWIDKETRRVLRIEQLATTMPRGYVYSKVESTLEYGFVDIEGKRYLLPVKSENVACMAGTPNCSRNVIEFRNYRKFGSDSKIVFDKFASKF